MTNSVTPGDWQLVQTATWVEFEAEKSAESRQEYRLKMALTAVLALNLMAVCSAITLALLILTSN